MAARDDATDSELDSETSRRFPSGISTDEELQKSVGVAACLHNF